MKLKIIKEGYKEITLLGQNVDSYGKDLDGKPTFAKLLAELDKLEGDFRIRFTTSYPTDITDEVIETVKMQIKSANVFIYQCKAGMTGY